MRTAALTGVGLTLAMAISTAADATTIFDLSGTADVCVFTGHLQDCNWQRGVEFAGMVEISVNPAGAQGTDVRTDGTTFLTDLDSWVSSLFLIEWDGGTFTSSTSGGASVSRNLGTILNNRNQRGVLTDGLALERSSERASALRTTTYNGAQLLRSTTDTTWLDGLSFPESLGLAPSLNAVNLLSFWHYDAESPLPVEVDPSTPVASESGGPIEDGDFRNYLGVRGSLRVSSMAARSNSVAIAEPASLGLFGLGIGLLAFVNRSRGTRSHGA